MWLGLMVGKERGCDKRREQAEKWGIGRGGEKRGKGVGDRRDQGSKKRGKKGK